MNTMIKAAMETVMKTKTSRTTMPLNFGRLFGLSLMALTSSATAALLPIADAPLFVTNASKANVLVILDNSNSMDENTLSWAVGSDSTDSKSEIARKVVRDLIVTYDKKINMGLMAYQQSNVQKFRIHNSLYDASFDPANYDNTFTGPRDSLTKRYSSPNLSNPGASIYFNIARPFYASANYGSKICYSAAANFDNGIETYPAGPWDSYDCYFTKSNTTDDTTGLSSYWFSFPFSPTDTDVAENILDFGTFNTWDYVGRTWFSNSSPGGGYLHTPIDYLDATQASALNKKLAVSQFVDNKITDKAFSLQNAGLTPIEGTLLSAKQYFEGTLSGSLGGGTGAPPESCGKNYIALLTDGLPSVDKNGNAFVGGAVTDSAAAAAALESAKIGSTQEGVDTYVIGFAVGDPTPLDTIAISGGTKKGYFASDPASLALAFGDIFNDILGKSGASSSAATNSTSLNSGSHIYQAKFNSIGWSGQLLAKTISTLGVLGTGSTWDAAEELPVASAREIITYDRNTNDGIPFQWADIAPTITPADTTNIDILNSDASGTADAKGSDRVRYLRGEAITGFRPRPIVTTVTPNYTNRLGDIVNSTPFFLGKPDAGHAESEMFGYSAFRTANSGRAPMIFAGANDGMLHGFNTVTGVEEIAYVPDATYAKLSALTDPAYGGGISHSYFVDGSPMVADANLGGGTTLTADWKTVLAGGFNAGGKGYYALDVTDAASLTEADAANFVLWEFTDEDDPDMGYSFNQPTLNRLTNQSAQIARMANGKWALIVGNGYNNTESGGSGNASLFIIYLNGVTTTDKTWTLDADYIKIDTNVGSSATPNGLSTPRPIDTTGDGRVDVIYAGDLEGNMWKFDVSAVSDASWGLAYGAAPFYKATDSSGNAQPITSAPVVTLAPGGDYIVGFATGLYLGLNDITSINDQTIYAILDKGSAVLAVTPPRSNLQAQTVLSTPTVTIPGFANPVKTRITSENTVNYATQKGWYMDLPDTGERVAFNPILRDGRFVFVTLIPDSGVCSAGGSGWIMELDYLTGAPPAIPPFIGAPGDPSGINLPGIPNTPTVIQKPEGPGPREEVKIVNESTGDTDVITESVQHKSGRLLWREIR